MLMADFMLSARTMNFDGRSSLWVRKLTMYTRATAGGKYRESQGRVKTGQFKLRRVRMDGAYLLVD
jgi:hypothetical protein